jgi:hypothetical protein
MTESEIINERLALYYGSEIDGRARYRVTWSTGEVEKRVGEFNEFYGQIFLRTFVGMREVPKYPYDPDRWIIEKLFYLRHTEVLTEKPGTYEPVHILKDGNGNFLPLNWKVVQIIVDFAEQRPVGIQLTDKDWKEEERKEIDTEAGYFEDVLDEQGRSPLFAFENSVFVDSTKRFA